VHDFDAIDGAPPEGARPRPELARAAGFRAAFEIPDGTLWLRAGPKRQAREIAGATRLGLAVPEARGGHLVYPRLPPRHGEPWRLSPAHRGEVRRFAETRRTLLAAWSGRRPAKGFVDAGARRRDVDRFLDTAVEVETRWGTTLGGVPAKVVREGACLRCDRVADGPFALDAVALGLEVEGEVGELARLALALRDGPRGVLREAVAPEAVPERVRVSFQGPSFVDPAVWGLSRRSSVEVDARRARWLLRELDGLVVSDGTLRVRTEPPIRKGRGGPRRQPRSARQRALFSRWDRGVQVDEEGLYSLTPEPIAMDLARGARGVVIDGTAGLGGLAIAYARQPGVERVVAVERDAERAARLRHNAALYDVELEVRVGDLTDLLGVLRGDLLVLDPPWGGPGARPRTPDELPFPLLAILARWPGPASLKLPLSFQPLEGFERRLVVDERGVPKFLWFRRG
jgi:hypothetical protein